MKLHQLRDVLAIAERGSLRAAARYLHHAQPALTRSVRELERELGVPLFERQTKGMALTPMGEAFVKRASAILNEVRKTREEVEQLHGGTRGSVVAALSIAPHIAMLPKALRPFRARYPQVRLHLIEGFYPTVESGLKDGKIDFYIGPRPEKPVPRELSQEMLFKNTRMILARRQHPLANARSLRGLVDAEWATTSVTLEVEEELGQLFARNDLPAPQVVLRTQSALTLMISLAHTDLLAMVPVQWSKFEPTARSLARIAVKEPLPAPPIVIIRRAGLPLTPAAEHFADLIRRQSL